MAPKATKKSGYLDSLVGKEVVLIDKYSEKITISATPWLLKEIDDERGYFIVEASGITIAFSFGAVRGITEYIKGNA